MTALLIIETPICDLVRVTSLYNLTTSLTVTEHFIRLVFTMSSHITAVTLVYAFSTVTSELCLFAC